MQSPHKKCSVNLENYTVRPSQFLYNGIIPGTFESIKTKILILTIRNEPYFPSSWLRPLNSVPPLVLWTVDGFLCWYIRLLISFFSLFFSCRCCHRQPENLTNYLRSKRTSQYLCMSFTLVKQLRWKSLYSRAFSSNQEGSFNCHKKPTRRTTRLKALWRTVVRHQLLLQTMFLCQRFSKYHFNTRHWSNL